MSKPDIDRIRAAVLAKNKQVPAKPEPKVSATDRLQKIRQNLLAIRSGATPAEMSERMRDLCNLNGYDPVYELLELIRVGYKVTIKDADGNEITEYQHLDPKDQIAIHKDMLKYIYPQLKAVDIQAHVDANISVTIKNYGDDKIPINMKQAIDADFSMIGEKITENVAKIRQQNAEHANA